MNINCNSFSGDLCLDYDIVFSQSETWIMLIHKEYQVYDSEYIQELYSFELWILMVVCLIFWLFGFFNLINR
jgi:hypothetical protein